MMSLRDTSKTSRGGNGFHAGERAVGPASGTSSPVRGLPVLPVDARLDQAQDLISLEEQGLGKDLPNEPTTQEFSHKGASRVAPIVTE